MQVKYIANDGTEFLDEAQCRAYEHLIEAGKNKHFRALVTGLFHGVTHHEYTDDPTDGSEEMFNLRRMDKFTANLVVALPALQAELQKALAATAPKS